MTNTEKEMAVAPRETHAGISVTAETEPDVPDARHAHPAGVNTSARPASESRHGTAGDARPARVPRRRLSRRNLLL
jgi:hypothetical protein